MRGAENETAGDTFSGAGRADVKFTKEYHPKPTRRPGFTATTEYASSWPSAIAGGFACIAAAERIFRSSAGRGDWQETVVYRDA